MDLHHSINYLIDRGIVFKFSSSFGSQYFGDSSRKSCLTMINMSNSTHIDMRFGSSICGVRSC